VVLAEDETHINLLPLGALDLDHQRLPPAGHDPGTNQRRTIFGAVDVSSGRFVYQVCRKAVSASFTAFCEQLLAAYPTAPVVAVVCDNVVIHHSKLVQAWLAAHPWVRVLHGARYSPHDNPVERTWGALKAYLANSLTPTMAGRIRQVHTFRQRSPTQLLATAAPHSSPLAPRRTGTEPSGGLVVLPVGSIAYPG
jgi:transposase